MTQSKKLFENLETNDLKRLVTSSLHIDEYKSKMGNDEDICVLSVKIKGKEPANDLVAFLEKGYDFILDADVSSGEKEDGDYLVFIEVSRTNKLPEQIIKMVEDILNLTDQKLNDWKIRYQKQSQYTALTQENIQELVPLTPEDYKARYVKETTELDQLKTAAGVDVTTKAPVNDLTDSLRVAAGIK